MKREGEGCDSGTWRRLSHCSCSGARGPAEMRALLLILGCAALGLVLVAASHQDQEESEIEARSEGAQGDFVKDREIRSTGGKKTKPPKKTGAWSIMGRPSKTKEKRSAKVSSPQRDKPKKCRGCFTSLIKKDDLKSFKPLSSAARQQRDTEEHVKIKKQKHLKSKNKEKRRRSKGHKHRHHIYPTEGPEIGHNKRRKHHRGKKEREHGRTGMFTGLAGIPDTKEKMHPDNRNTQDMTE